MKVNMKKIINTTMIQIIKIQTKDNMKRVQKVNMMISIMKIKRISTKVKENIMIETMKKLYIEMITRKTIGIKINQKRDGVMIKLKTVKITIINTKMIEIITET